MEMETWVPERLPAQFRPRSTTCAAQQVWRPLAVGLAVLLIAGAMFAREGPPGGMKIAVHFVMMAAGRLAPQAAPAVTPAPTAPSRSVQQQPAVPPPQSTIPTMGVTPMPAPIATVPGEPPPTEAPAPTPEPSGLLPQIVSPPPPAESPEPSPTTGFCLPLLRLCL